MNINLNDIIGFLLSPDIQAGLVWVRFGFLLFATILVGILIFLINRTHYFKWLFIQNTWEFFTFRPFGARRINRVWQKILKRLDSGLETEYKLAVIEADKMMDTSLKRMGYAGQALKERLEKFTPVTMPNIEDVRQAHELRNNIAHNPDYRLGLEEVRTALEAYEKAFNTLQILT